MTLGCLIEELKAVKGELKDKEVKTNTLNGMRHEPEIRFVLEDGPSLDITNENVKHIILE